MNIVRFMLQNHTQVFELTLEHLWLVGISTALAVAIGVPLGILIAEYIRRRIARNAAFPPRDALAGAIAR